MDYTHGIPGQILKGQFHSPNGGISATHWDVTIVGPDVNALKLTNGATLRPVRPNAPAVIVAGIGYGPTLRPLADPDGKTNTPYMASGAWVTMARGSLYEDAWISLFGARGPVPLHDRTETWGLYNILSD
jgi:hypothetical protein